jgi:hypothetical protein
VKNLVTARVLHAEGPSDRLRALIAVAKRLVERARGAEVCVLVIDEAPLDADALRRTLKALVRGCDLHVRMKSSRKVAGLQLADLVAGFVREQYLKGSRPEL